jgi:protocatechuate 3,4-dioxygenase beta subunit
MRTALLASLLAMSSLWAQGEAVNARLTGTVFDQANAAVPGAKVTLSSATTGFVRQLLTGDEGQYTFLSVPPGRYQLEVEKVGFQVYRQTNVALAVAQSSLAAPQFSAGSTRIAVLG